MPAVGELCGGLSPIPGEPHSSSPACCQQRADLDLLFFFFFLKFLASFLCWWREQMFVKQPARDRRGFLALL